MQSKAWKTFCLHSYAKEISLETLQELEKSPVSNDYGLEVNACLPPKCDCIQALGMIRCPLYTLPNGLGFPAFLKHRFIADSKDQLLHTIRERKLLSQSELQTAVDNCDHIKTLVTV